MGRSSKPWYRTQDGWWYATVVKGTPRQKLLKGKPTKADERKASDIFNRLKAEQKPLLEFDNLPAADLVESFLTHAQANRKATTYRTYADNLNHFTGFCGKVLCRDLSLAHADRLLKRHATKKPSKRTTTIMVDGKKRKHVVTLRPWGQNKQATFCKSLNACFNWGVKRKHVSRNPFTELEYSFAAKTRTVVADETFAAILKEADQPLSDLLTALRETGCRPSEVARVTAEDVHGPTWVFQEHKTDRGGESRVVWLNQTMRQITKRLQDAHPNGPLFLNSRGEPWTKDAIVCRFRKIRNKLALPKSVIAYALGRHSYITTALTNGVPTAVVAHLTGTSERVIRKHYAHLDSQSKFMLACAEQATRRSS